jgi:hypothetical protein
MVEAGRRMPLIKARVRLITKIRFVKGIELTVNQEIISPAQHNNWFG